jgi:hypothetical protein
LRFVPGLKDNWGGNRFRADKERRDAAADGKEKKMITSWMPKESRLWESISESAFRKFIPFSMKDQGAS